MNLFQLPLLFQENILKQKSKQIPDCHPLNADSSFLSFSLFISLIFSVPRIQLEFTSICYTHGSYVHQIK